MQTPDIQSIRSDVELLKKDGTHTSALLDKIDVAIDKISHATNDISKILTAHQLRIDQIEDTADQGRRVAEKNVDALHARISQKEHELKENMIHNHQELMSFLRDHDERSRESWREISERVATLEKWKWYVVGLGTMVGVVVLQFAQRFIQSL